LSVYATVMLCHLVCACHAWSSCTHMLCCFFVFSSCLHMPPFFYCSVPASILFTFLMFVITCVFFSE
jgi:hypothetical protein